MSRWMSACEETTSWEVPGEEDKQLSLVGKSFWGYDKDSKKAPRCFSFSKRTSQAGTLEGAYLFVLDGAKGFLRVLRFAGRNAA